MKGFASNIETASRTNTIARRCRTRTCVAECIGGVHGIAFTSQLSGQPQPLEVRVSLIKGTRSKEDRARVAAAQMERGEVYLPETATWRPTVDHELLAFARCRAHDHIVDYFSVAAIAEVMHRISGTLSTAQVNALVFGGRVDVLGGV